MRIAWGAGQRGGGGLQHGPSQCGCFCRSLDVLRPEHLTWIHSKQDEHCTDVGFSFNLQMLHFQMGPGFCSIPALISNSQSNLAGRNCLVVRQVKNTN